jgi:hypothetical protein
MIWSSQLLGRMGLGMDMRGLQMKANLSKFCLALVATGGIAVFSAGNAMAQSSCQADMQKVMAPRQALLARVNGFAKRRPTPDQACSTFSSLAAADGRAVKWMTDNKDWCQVPDELLEQMKGASGQIIRARSQSCTAAKNFRAQVAKIRAQQRRAAEAQSGGGGGPPAVGSGVRLPSGAL